jgi:hypothetical protein
MQIRLCSTRVLILLHLPKHWQILLSKSDIMLFIPKSHIEIVIKGDKETNFARVESIEKNHLFSMVQGRTDVSS